MFPGLGCTIGDAVSGIAVVGEDWIGGEQAMGMTMAIAAIAAVTRLVLHLRFIEVGDLGSVLSGGTALSTGSTL